MKVKSEKDKALLISIKPKYMNKILSGEKKVELRKSSSKISTGGLVILYSTFPEKAVVGFCFVENIKSDTPQNMWQNVKSFAGISRKDYLEYYSNSRKSCGIFISNVNYLEAPFSLENLRKEIPNFQPPQSYTYTSSAFWIDLLGLKHRQLSFAI